MNAEQTIRQIHEVVGRVSLQATHLQLTAATTAAVGLGWSQDDVGEALGKPGRKPQQALEQLIRLVPRDPLGRKIEQFVDDVDACLEQRNRIAHSVVLLVPSEGGPTPEAWHPRTNTVVNFFEGIAHLEDRLGAATSDGMRLGLEVQAWRDAHVVPTRTEEL